MVQCLRTVDGHTKLVFVRDDVQRTDVRMGSENFPNNIYELVESFFLWGNKNMIKPQAKQHLEQQTMLERKREFLVVKWKLHG